MERGKDKGDDAKEEDMIIERGKDKRDDAKEDDEIGQLNVEDKAEQDDGENRRRENRMKKWSECGKRSVIPYKGISRKPKNVCQNLPRYDRRKSIWLNLFTSNVSLNKTYLSEAHVNEEVKMKSMKKQWALGINVTYKA